MDQSALDAAYDQSQHAANFAEVGRRMAHSSALMREQMGDPEVHEYGTEPLQRLHLYRAGTANAPMHVHVHGGAWRQKSALDQIFPAAHFVSRGISFAIFDFVSVEETSGDLRPVLADVCAALAWLARHAVSLGGDPERLYVSGFSSGAHLASTALLSDWTVHGLPRNPYRSALLASGMYDLLPVRLSSRSNYVNFTDEVEQSMSPLRHLERFEIPLTLLYGNHESPEFQRQTRDFARALDDAGKPVTLAVAEGFNHLEVLESLGDPVGPMGRAAMQQTSGA